MTLNELIVSLCGLPTVSGSERRSTEALRGLIGAAFDEMQVDALGNHLFIKRCGRQDAPKILIDTHLDEIGMMVNGYRDGGFLTVANVGGVDTRILPAGEVVIYGKETLYGVVAAEPAYLLPAADAEKLKPITEMVIDTGYSKEELEALAEVCLRHDIYIIADEIYYRLCYDGRKFTSVAALGEEVKKHTIIINGVSKSYSMTGWRLGYLIGPENVIEGAKKVHDFLTVGAAAPLQEAAVVGLNFPQSYYDGLTELYTRKRQVFLDGLDRIGLKHTVPQGSYFVMVDISDFQKPGMRFHGKNDMEFCEWMIRTIGVAAVPGSSFFREPENRLIRLHFARSEETLNEALERLAKLPKLV